MKDDEFTRSLNRGFNAAMAQAGVTPRQRLRDLRRPAMVTTLPKLNRLTQRPRRVKFLPGQQELFA